LCVALGAIAVALTTGGVAAQVSAETTVKPYPSRPIRILVGGQPGGLADTSARLIAEKLEVLWSNPVVVENQSGAGGTIGAEAVAKSPADGYTLLLAGQSNLVLARAVGKNLRYDAQRDFAAIGGIMQAPFALAVNASVPVNSVPELIAYAKTRPGKLTYATNGPGTLSQFSVELFLEATGIEMLAVPYRGIPSAIIDVVAGRIDMILTDYMGLAPHAKSGVLRLIGAAGAKRLSEAPTVPTIAEQGLDGYAVSGWYGLLAPAGTPPAILAKLSDALSQVRRMRDVRRRLEELGNEPIDDTPAEFRALIDSEMERYSGIAQRPGVTTN
jgi:tripartite-type tricarboxylate transporter receptor subunit TctC